VAGNKEASLRGVLIGSMTNEDGLSIMNTIRTSLEYPPITEGGLRRNKTRRIKIKHVRRAKTYRLRDDEKID